MTFGIMPWQPTDRVAITGMGVVSPIGQDVTTYWSGLVTGKCGISAIERFSTAGMRVGAGGEIKALRDHSGAIPSPLPKCRASQFLILAASEALQMAHWHEASCTDQRLGVVIGSALGGIDQAEFLLERPRDLHALTDALYDGPTRNLAHWLRVTGPVMTISTACASGATSLGVAADLLRAGTATAVLAGGVDILCRFVMQGFNRLRSLTRDTVRPFDRRRNGLLLGEGAGIVVLERASTARQRGVQPLAFLRGHASCADGAHISAPDTAGRGLEYTVRLAMHNAGVVPEQIDFISAHGTGTPVNDRIETLVFKNVLGARAYAIPINSIKAHMGHTMGAAAILEAIMCILAWQHGQIPPTLNYGEPDPECDLDYVPNQVRSVRPRISLKTAAGFAGCNACLVLEGAA
jgi:3-oxoacyl-[acyl-carrier-protein] synthase II